MTDHPTPTAEPWGTVAEGYCSAREDEQHCNHWWDGEACCSCGAPGMTDEQKREQGMIE